MCTYIYSNCKVNLIGKSMRGRERANELDCPLKKNSKQLQLSSMSS